MDDPYLFGQIAAANALSDIYAMGAKPSLAMNLLCYPTCLAQETVQAILAGGYDKVMEAGAVIAGGHTIQDSEPKYGLCVSGFVHPDKILANRGAKPGDCLILTKPLGVGVMTTAAKADLLTAEEFAPAVASMAALNRTAAEIAERYHVHSCTDVTGFGLLGHAYEMANAGKISIRIFSEEIPFLPKSQELADMGILPGGAYQNQAYLEDKVQYHSNVPRVRRDLLVDPQTSGGLLLAVDPNDADDLLAQLRDSIPTASVIGAVADANTLPLSVE